MNQKFFGVWVMCIFLFCFWLSGCSQTKEALGIGYANKDVQYTINGDQITHNADSVSSSTSGTYSSETLVWYCGNYKGQSNIEVDLSFSKKSGGTWVLTSENTSKGTLCR
jgi:hypothetical protein